MRRSVVRSPAGGARRTHPCATRRKLERPAPPPPSSRHDEIITLSQPTVGPGSGRRRRWILTMRARGVRGVKRSHGLDAASRARPQRSGEGAGGGLEDVALTSIPRDAASRAQRLARCPSSDGHGLDGLTCTGDPLRPMQWPRRRRRAASRPRTDGAGVENPRGAGDAGERRSPRSPRTTGRVDESRREPPSPAQSRPRNTLLSRCSRRRLATREAHAREAQSPWPRAGDVERGAVSVEARVLLDRAPRKSSPDRERQREPRMSSRCLRAAGREPAVAATSVVTP